MTSGAGPDPEMSAKIREQVEAEQRALAVDLQISTLLERPTTGKSRLKAHAGQRRKRKKRKR